MVPNLIFQLIPIVKLESFLFKEEMFMISEFSESSPWVALLGRKPTGVNLGE